MTPLSAAIPRSQSSEELQWLTPAPLWNTVSVGAASSGLTQPWIAELRSDTFVQDFLGLLARGAAADALAATVPQRIVDGTATLFQPLSQCYYLVNASLVCRRPGIPDHAVAAAAGERVSFVIRQIATDGEHAWLPAGQGSWVTAAADQLALGEEQLPMHAAAVAGFAEDGTAAAILGMAAGTESSRSVLYGYVPVARRQRIDAASTELMATRLPQTYIIRVVFQHDPCRPVLSAPSRQFVLASPLEKSSDIANSAAEVP